MRRWCAVVALVAGSACSGGSSGTSTPTTDAMPCLRVSDSSHASLSLRVDSATAAVKGNVIWYVSTADGATWAFDTDPGVISGGHAAALNRAALASSPLGSANGIGGPYAHGATDADPGAVRSRQCALEAERR